MTAKYSKIPVDECIVYLPLRDGTKRATYISQTLCFYCGPKMTRDGKIIPDHA